MPHLVTPASSELYKSDIEVMFYAYGQKIPTSKILVESYSDQAGDYFAGEKITKQTNIVISWFMKY